MNYLKEPARFPRNEHGWNQDFGSVGELVDLITQPVAYRPNECASQRFIPTGWNGTRSFNEAVKLALTGWEEGVEKVLKIRDKLEADIRGQIPISRLEFDVSGDFIDMGRYLTGEPENFGFDEDTEFRRDSPIGKVIHIVVNIGASSTLDPKVIIARGATIAALISLLEMTGKRCEVDAVTATYSSNGSDNRGASKSWYVQLAGYTFSDMWLTRIRLKEANEPLEISKMVMMLAHPSALRRLVFAAYERAPQEAVDFFQFRDTLGWYGVPGNVPNDDESCEPYERRRGDIYLPTQYSPALFYDIKRAKKWIQDQLKVVGVKLEEGVTF